MNKHQLTTLLLFIPFLSTSGLFAQSTIKTDTARKKDTLENHVLHEVVVSASRRSESILKAPVTIEILNNNNIKRSAAPSFFG